MPTQPNILFFFTDDQRFDTIHALGKQLLPPTGGRDRRDRESRPQGASIRIANPAPGSTG